MGNMHAAAAAEAVNEGWASLRQAISMNLSSNHYPPIPTEYVEPVIKAIEAANEGDVERDIDIEVVRATGMVPRLAEEQDDSLTITAANLLEITHSWGFVDDED